MTGEGTIQAVLAGEARWAVVTGDCLDVMRAMPDASVDSIVTDPPAGISFMNAAFDDDRGGRDAWIAWLRERLAEALRVLKPGGHALVWAIPRTSHWTGMAIELAGFEVRDCVSHLFGSGFPKSLNLSKAIDRAVGAKRKVVGKRTLTGNAAQTTKEKGGTYAAATDSRGAAPIEVPVTEPATPEAKAWDGWGTALKPAVEFWFLCRKPIAAKSIARQVLATGTGALNVDACRVAGMESTRRDTGTKAIWGDTGRVFGGSDSGRYPANLVLSHSPSCVLVGERKVKAAPPWNDNRGPSTFTGTETSPVHHSDADGTETVPLWVCVPGCAVRALDETSGEHPASGRPSVLGKSYWKTGFGDYGSSPRTSDYMDTGGTSRFFNVFPGDPFIYAAKASRGERENGLEHRGHRKVNDGRDTPIDNPFQRGESARQNTHPTVKSIFLMRFLCRLVTPPGGIILDLFTGSGSTGVACSAEGFRFVGIELEAEYAAIARDRIRGDAPLFNVVAQ